MRRPRSQEERFRAPALSASRRQFSPVAGLALEEAGGAEEGALGKLRRHDLQREWKTLAREAGGDGDGRDSDQIRGRGEDVTEVHRQWIVRLGADWKRRLGCRRRQQV